jgi:hypothetical protein
MHEETYMGERIVPVETFGVLQLYKMPTYRKMHHPKYIVFHKNGKALETFRRNRAAVSWAKRNQNG